MFQLLYKGYHPTEDQYIALGHYTGDDSGVINSYIAGETIEDPVYNDFLQELPGIVENITASAIPCPIDCTIYRGSNSDRFAKMNIGDEFSNKAFLSTSISPYEAFSFTEASKDNPIPVLTRLHLKKGTRIIPGNHGEKEIILLPKHRFRIVGKKEVQVQIGWKYSGAEKVYAKTLIVDLELVK